MRPFLLPIALAGLLLTLGSGGALAEESGPAVAASTYRVDLGAMVPGEVQTGQFTLTALGYDPVTVRFAHQRESSFLDLPSEVTVSPGDPTVVKYTASVPLGAAPGFRGDAVRLVGRSANLVEGSGSLDAGTAIVFSLRVSALGVSAIEVPPILLADEDVRGNVTLVSTWAEDVNASVRIEWRDGTGTLLGAALLGPAFVASQETVTFPLHLPAAAASRGEQTITARVVDAGSAPIGAESVQRFHAGVRQATYQLTGVEDLRDGNATIRFTVENTGDVPITFTPRVTLIDATGAERAVLLPPITLAPGERREVTNVIPIPAGKFGVRLDADGADAAFSPAFAKVVHLELHMREPGALSAGDWALRLAATVLALAILFALVRSLWPRRARILAALPRPRLPRRRRADPFDALFAHLESGISHHARAIPAPAAFTASGRATLHLDVDTLGRDALTLARLSTLSAGWHIVAAYAYARANTEAEAIALAQELSAAGFIPRIFGPTADVRVPLTVDAMRAARDGHAVLLATSDPAYGALLRALRDEGVEAQGLVAPRAIPVLNIDRPETLAAKGPST